MKSTETYFLVSQEDLDRIDSLIGALNLAVSEILESRPVRDHRSERTALQQQYDELVTPYLYPDPDRVRQTEFDF